MIAFIQANIGYFILGFISVLLLIAAFSLGLTSMIRRVHGMQRQQASQFKNMMNACRYLIELNRKVEKLAAAQQSEHKQDKPEFSPNRLFRTDSAYQYAIQLFETGRSIDEVVESTQLSWGEAELIKTLHAS